MARVGEVQIGQVEPRVGARLGKLMKGGNRYEAAITVVSGDEVRIIIRETFAHPDNFGKVSLPRQLGRPAGWRPTRHPGQCTPLR